jgi:hypothetical protein
MHRGEHSGNRKLFLDFCHCRDYVDIHGFGVAAHRDRDAGMAQNSYALHASHATRSRGGPTAASLG